MCGCNYTGPCFDDILLQTRVSWRFNDILFICCVHKLVTSNLNYFVGTVMRHLHGDIWVGCIIQSIELPLHPIQVHGWMDWLHVACGPGNCMGCGWCNIQHTDQCSSWHPLPPWYCAHLVLCSLLTGFDITTLSDLLMFVWIVKFMV